MARDTGVTVFRMGFDWTRIMPLEPVNGLKESVSQINILIQFYYHILFVVTVFLNISVLRYVSCFIIGELCCIRTLQVDH